MGRGPRSVARGPVVWLHGASVGELVAARGIAKELLRRDPRLRLVVTANTATGREQAQGWGEARVDARLAPIDTRWALARFLAGWQPVALVTIENEIWPNRMAMAKARRVPVLVAGARMSARSARLWGRFPGIARQILGLIDFIAPQDDETAERLRRLGLPPRRIGARLNLKAAVQVAGPDPAEIAAFARALPRDDTILAASTHPGEEEILLTAFRKAREFRPELKLILAPRHPERGEQLALLASSAGQPVARRSRGDRPGPKTSVYLADTLGEMGLWYRLAAVTFVGGSLVPKGGHTPFEPAACGSAIIHGPHVANNAEAYRALAAARASAEVSDAGTLTAEMLRLLGNPEGRTNMVRRAQKALAGTGTGPEAVADFVARIGAMTGNRALETPARR
nr:glycosyltransferase N-terminal domain-containing protein [Frigidibacter sp. ROC022]